MKLPFSEQEVQDAIDLKLEHPFIDLLEKHRTRIEQASDIPNVLMLKNDQQHYINQYMLPIADDSRMLPSFEIGPLELIAVWSKLQQHSGTNVYIGYETGRILCSTYAESRIPTKHKLGLASYYLRKKELPKELLSSWDIFANFHMSLMEFNNSYDKIYSYVNGHNISTSDAFEAAKENNLEILKQLEEGSKRKEQIPHVQLLDCIGENLGNALFGLRSNTERLYH